MAIRSYYSILNPARAAQPEEPALEPCTPVALEEVEFQEGSHQFNPKATVIKASFGWTFTVYFAPKSQGLFERYSHCCSVPVLPSVDGRCSACQRAGMFMPYGAMPIFDGNDQLHPKLEACLREWLDPFYDCLALSLILDRVEEEMLTLRAKLLS